MSLRALWTAAGRCFTHNSEYKYDIRKIEIEHNTYRQHAGVRVPTDRTNNTNGNALQGGGIKHIIQQPIKRTFPQCPAAAGSSVGEPRSCFFFNDFSISLETFQRNCCQIRKLITESNNLSHFLIINNLYIIQLNVLSFQVQLFSYLGGKFREILS